MPCLRSFATCHVDISFAIAFEDVPALAGHTLERVPPCCRAHTLACHGAVDVGGLACHVIWATGAQKRETLDGATC